MAEAPINHNTPVSKKVIASLSLRAAGHKTARVKLKSERIIREHGRIFGGDRGRAKELFRGIGNGQFYNPKGIAIDVNTNEVYIADDSNHRIQVMSVNGELLRSFTHNQMKATNAICLSEKELFVTDNESYLLKFDKLGKFLKQTGSRGTTPGCFIAISEVCAMKKDLFMCVITLVSIFKSKIYKVFLL